MYLVAASFRLYFLHDQEEYVLWSHLRLIIVRKTCSDVLDVQANDKLDRQNSKINYGNMKYVKIELIFQGHPAPHNPGQNIWNKIKKSSKTGQDKKSLISTFACFLTATAKV